MDTRISKANRSIVNAFLELRASKPIEKITVKELCERAGVNKSTFYYHYEDIYALSDGLENELVESVIRNLPNGSLLDNTYEFTKNLSMAYSACKNLTGILFSGSRRELFVTKIADSVKCFVYSRHPEYRNNSLLNTALDYVVYGSYYAYENKSGSEIDAIETIAAVSEAVFNTIGAQPDKR